MDNFSAFLSKGAELYLSAPQFFNWVIPAFFAFVAGAIWLAYWLGGKFADAEVKGLKAHIGALDQRFSLAKEQTMVSTQEAVTTKTQLEVLKKQIEESAPREVLQNSRSVLEGNLNRVVSANNAASHSLGMVSVGFDERGQLKWRPILPGEAHLLEPLGPTKRIP